MQSQSSRHELWGNVPMKTSSIACSIIVIVFAGCASPNSSDSTGGINPAVLELEHWYAEYNMDAQDNPNPPGTTLLQKYQNARLQPGMQEMLQREFQRLKSLISIQENAKIQPIRITGGQCSESPILLTQIQPAAGSTNICISTLLVQAMFIQSVDGQQMRQFIQQLQSWGVNPITFDGTYDQNLLGPKGETREDWQAYVNAQRNLLEIFQQSLDFVVARELEKVGSANHDPDAWNSAAKELVQRADQSFDITALIGTLSNAQSHNPEGDWGYERAGDITAFISSLEQIP